MNLLKKKQKMGYAATGALLGYFIIGGSKKVVTLSTRLGYVGIGLLIGFLGATIYLEFLKGI